MGAIDPHEIQYQSNKTARVVSNVNVWKEVEFEHKRLAALDALRFLLKTILSCLECYDFFWRQAM